MSSFHRTLTAEPWGRFEFADQIMMIANEAHRARKALQIGDVEGARGAYSLALDLADLTIDTRGRERSKRQRELCRFREVLAGECVAVEPSPGANRAILKVLLLFTPRSAEQTPYVCES